MSLQSPQRIRRRQAGQSLSRRGLNSFSFKNSCCQSPRSPIAPFQRSVNAMFRTHAALSVVGAFLLISNSSSALGRSSWLIIAADPAEFFLEGVACGSFLATRKPFSSRSSRHDSGHLRADAAGRECFCRHLISIFADAGATV